MIKARIQHEVRDPGCPCEVGLHGGLNDNDRDMTLEHVRGGGINGKGRVLSAKHLRETSLERVVETWESLESDQEGQAKNTRKLNGVNVTCQRTRHCF